MPHTHKQIMLDIAKVGGAAATATGVTLANVNVILTTISICLAICYTIWKWRNDFNKK